MKFNFSDESVETNVNEVLYTVYDALQEKGYNPINQIVGYLPWEILPIFLVIVMHGI
jgi:uncharacterized protein (UPF0297 family)